MRSHAAMSGTAVVGVAIAVLVNGCGSIVDPVARDALMRDLGNTSFTVFPAFIRTDVGSYDAAAAEQIGEFLTGDGLAEVTLSDEQVPITPSWQANQAQMLANVAAEFAAHIEANPIETEYGLLAEYLFGGTGMPVGIHCYILDAERRVALVELLNSHHEPFYEANPQTVEDCTAVLIGVLRDDLVPVE